MDSECAVCETVRAPAPWIIQWDDLPILGKRNRPMVGFEGGSLRTRVTVFCRVRRATYEELTRMNLSGNLSGNVVSRPNKVKEEM